MSEIVRGAVYGAQGKPSKQILLDKPMVGQVEVLILPIEDGKVGPFKKEMTTHLMAAAGQLDKEGYLTSPQIVRRIATAILRLFEEVESED